MRKKTENMSDVQIKLWTTDLIKALSEQGITDEYCVTITFTYSTNENDKAMALANYLKNGNHEVRFGQTALKEKTFCVTGARTLVPFEEKQILKWAKDMRKVGNNFDCKLECFGSMPSLAQKYVDVVADFFKQKIFHY